jgi:uncharacterized membrane protein YfcA
MIETIAFQFIILLAGFTQGFTGFGSVLVALPLLTFYLDVRTVVPLVVLFALVINVIIIIQIHKHIRWNKVRVLLIAAIPGIIFGVYILKTVRAQFLETAIGLVLVAFGLQRIFAEEPEREISDSWGWLFGFLSGVLGGSIGAGGPPVILYTSLQPWGKYHVKSTLTAYFLISSTVISSTHGVNHLITSRVLDLFLSGLPVLTAGVLAGSWLFGRIDSGSYRRVLLIALILLGCFMITKAVSSNWFTVS